MIATASRPNSLTAAALWHAMNMALEADPTSIVAAENFRSRKFSRMPKTVCNIRLTRASLVGMFSGHRFGGANA